MSGRPWYAFYPDDYERDAGHLSYVEDSAYRRLLDLYYKTGEPIPLDQDQIFRACKAMKRDERGAILKMLGLFFIMGDDGYHQLRADAEIIKAAELSQKRSAAANKRHANAHAIAHANAEQLDTHSTSTSTKIVSTDPKTGPSKPSVRRERKILSSLPDDCPNTSDREAARTYWAERGRQDLCSRLADEADAFRDHHRSRDNRMADWSAAWRTWYGRAVKYTPKPKGAMGQPVLGTDAATTAHGWETRLRMFREKGLWSANWGPKPDEAGCKCPPELLNAA